MKLGVTLSVIFGVIMIAALIWMKTWPTETKLSAKKTVNLQPEISGWIAWWEEEKGYRIIEDFPGKIKTASPVWFMVDENLNLREVGIVNYRKAVAKLKKADVRIMPSLGSEESQKTLSKLFNDQKKSDALIASFTASIKSLGVDGADIDLEDIRKADRDEFTQFIRKMSNQFKINNLKMSVAVHAQNGIPIWEGTEGQDLAEIGKIADEVRIMTYDEHSTVSGPGPVASLPWIKKVAIYTSTLIDKNKMVMGIPSYGYIWDDNPRGLQYNEIQSYLKSRDYKMRRDKASGELEIKGENFTGWLSDSQAMKSKMEALRRIGFNRFVIWHLGGMDENFFK